MEDIQPLGKRLLVEPEPEQTETSSGLILAKETKEKPMRGTVLAIGPSTEHVQSGNTVVFGKYSGSEILVDKKDLLILDEDDILAIVKGN